MIEWEFMHRSSLSVGTLTIQSKALYMAQMIQKTFGRMFISTQQVKSVSSTSCGLAHKGKVSNKCIGFWLGTDMNTTDLVERDLLPNLCKQVTHMISHGLSVLSMDSIGLANVYYSCNYREEGHRYELL